MLYQYQYWRCFSSTSCQGSEGFKGTWDNNSWGGGRGREMQITRQKTQGDENGNSIESFSSYIFID